jgi:hypothetical protein
VRVPVPAMLRYTPVALQTMRFLANKTIAVRCAT